MTKIKYLVDFLMKLFSLRYISTLIIISLLLAEVQGQGSAPVSDTSSEQLPQDLAQPVQTPEAKAAEPPPSPPAPPVPPAADSQVNPEAVKQPEEVKEKPTVKIEAISPETVTVSAEPQKPPEQAEPIQTGTAPEAAPPKQSDVGAAFLEADDEVDSYGLPGTQREFRIEVKGGGTECFFQKFKKGAQVHLSFQVMRGADKNIDLLITNPNAEVLEQLQWTSESTWNGVIGIDGVHTICFDNSHSRFSSKLIYFYLISYVEEDWRKFAQESQKYLGSIDNFAHSLLDVDKKLNKMAVMQATSRRHMIKDFYLVKSNKTYVQNLSIAMCTIIIVCAGFQVYFVRKLFNPGNVQGSKGFRVRA